jgi:hypothetical protein
VAAFCFAPDLPLFELARVLVRLDHVARFNIFGISELIGYQAPLVFALTWRRDPRANTLVALSWIFYVVVCVAVALNLSSLDRQGLVWAYVKPVQGLAQRALFAAWFGWSAVIGVFLFQRTRSIMRIESIISALH